MGFPYVGDKTFDFFSKNYDFCPKKSKFGLKMAFLFILGQALPAHLVGGCGARAVPRKTPIYFIIVHSDIIYIWTCVSRGKASNRIGQIKFMWVA